MVTGRHSQFICNSKMENRRQNLTHVSAYINKQEKAYVTGVEAANRVVDLVGEGSFAKIIAVVEDEPHVEALRTLNRRFSEISEQIPLFDYFIQ